jgi:hydroxyacylglutathione hydrolase
MEDGARRLFQSLQRFKELPDYLQIWPGHGAGSACGKALGAVPSSTVGYEKLFNWGLNVETEEAFVKAVLEGQPEPPVYFKEMKRINRDGASMAADLPEPRHLPIPALKSAIEEGIVVVDTRPGIAFAGGYIPGTISIPSGSSFLTWAGWLLPYDRPFALIADERDAANLAHQLRLIGLDHVSGFWAIEVVVEWAGSHGSLAVFNQITADTLRDRIEQQAPVVVDVRNSGEYEAGHLTGSRNIPLGYLRDRLAEIPADEPVVIHCLSGVRSAIATSILVAAGRTNVIDLIGGYAAWTAAGLPVETGSRELASV